MRDVLVSKSLKVVLPVTFLAGAAFLSACSHEKSSSKQTMAAVTAHPVVASVSAAPATQPGVPSVRAASPVEAGKYLVVVGGCNDCHTPGFAATGGEVPEMLWLTGNPVGFRGPWGTTYAANLRLSLKDMKADDWVTITRARHDKPPMPWTQLHGMSEGDLRAVYAYVKSLPVTGPATPAYVPPTQEPKTPYVDMMPKNLPAGDGAAQ